DLATAADFQSPPPPAPAYDWTGWYIGLSAGYDFNNANDIVTKSTNTFAFPGAGGRAWPPRSQRCRLLPRRGAKMAGRSVVRSAIIGSLRIIGSPASKRTIRVCPAQAPPVLSAGSR